MATFEKTTQEIIADLLLTAISKLAGELAPQDRLDLWDRVELYATLEQIAAHKAVGDDESKEPVRESDK